MLHPDQFTVNEAWLVFRLNEAPLATDLEGDFNCFALMDAASCFILSTTLAPTGESEPSRMAIRQLFRAAKAHKQQLPKKIFVPNGQFIRIFPDEARRLKIAIARVPEDDLLVFISEARESFAEHLGGRSAQ